MGWIGRALIQGDKVFSGEETFQLRPEGERLHAKQVETVCEVQGTAFAKV